MVVFFVLDIIFLTEPYDSPVISCIANRASCLADFVVCPCFWNVSVIMAYISCIKR